jgi:hypothetical protein
VPLPSRTWGAFEIGVYSHPDHIKNDIPAHGRCQGRRRPPINRPGRKRVSENENGFFDPDLAERHGLDEIVEPVAVGGFNNELYTLLWLLEVIDNKRNL